KFPDADFRIPKSRERITVKARLEQRSIDFTSASMVGLLDRIRVQYFAELERRVIWCCCETKSLARLDVSRFAAVIRLHMLLNHQDTPEEVFSFILKHE